MKLLYKRILILFSVALNIGVVIMAIALIYHHSKPQDDRSWRELAEIVKRLDLPASQSRAALDDMRKFRSSMDNLDEGLQRARGDILRLAARSGPVDREELHRLIEAADHYSTLKGELFETHVMELRRLLGDEKGAQFFSLLQKHIESKDKKQHR